MTESFVVPRDEWTFFVKEMPYVIGRPVCFRDILPFVNPCSGVDIQRLIMLLAYDNLPEWEYRLSRLAFAATGNLARWSPKKAFVHGLDDAIRYTLANRNFLSTLSARAEVTRGWLKENAPPKGYKRSVETTKCVLAAADVLLSLYENNDRSRALEFLHIAFHSGLCARADSTAEFRYHAAAFFYAMQEVYS